VVQNIKENFDWDYLYYIFCVKLGRGDEEFWDSYMCKIFALIDLYIMEQETKAESMDENALSYSMEDIL